MTWFKRLLGLPEPRDSLKPVLDAAAYEGEHFVKVKGLNSEQAWELKKQIEVLIKELGWENIPDPIIYSYLGPYAYRQVERSAAGGRVPMSEPQFGEG